MRTGTLSLLRSVLRQAGYRLPRASSVRVVARLDALEVPAWLRETLAPLRRTIERLTEEIGTVDARLDSSAASDPIVQRLQTVPSVGPIVALTFRTFVDDITRFGTACQVSAAIGFVPREDSSAARRHRGHITKAGPRELRSLLVQARWASSRTRDAEHAEPKKFLRALRVPRLGCSVQSDRTRFDR